MRKSNNDTLHFHYPTPIHHCQFKKEKGDQVETFFSATVEWRKLRKEWGSGSESTYPTPSEKKNELHSSQEENGLKLIVILLDGSTHPACKA